LVHDDGSGMQDAQNVSSSICVRHDRMHDAPIVLHSPTRDPRRFTPLHAPAESMAAIQDIYMRGILRGSMDWVLRFNNGPGNPRVRAGLLWVMC